MELRKFNDMIRQRKVAKKYKDFPYTSHPISPIVNILTSVWNICHNEPIY